MHHYHKVSMLGMYDILHRNLPTTSSQASSVTIPSNVNMVMVSLPDVTITLLLEILAYGLHSTAIAT